jgi:GT2 family glycosyltransferase
MRIAFVFTNFNNSLLTIQAVNSIIENKFDIYCNIFIIDNDSCELEKKILFNNYFPKFVVIIWNKKNIGYFPGLNLGLDYITHSNLLFDLVVVGNNDLVFDHDFFKSANFHLTKLSDYSVVSPSILTLDGIYQNPHLLNQASRFREILWDLYYSNFYVSKIMLHFSYYFKKFFNRNGSGSHAVSGFINQGYGACYILTPKFFLKYMRFWAPSILMGEEFHLSRQLKSSGDGIFYFPSLIVFHHDHATISKIPSKLLWLYSKEAHIIYRFFLNPYRLNMDNNRTVEDFNNKKVS